jgi:hypothetical protein
MSAAGRAPRRRAPGAGSPATAPGTARLGRRALLSGAVLLALAGTRAGAEARPLVTVHRSPT